MANSPERAIREKTALVGVIGLGYVGLPLIRAFIAAGYRTMGFDVDSSKVERLLAGQSYIGHISSEWIARLHPKRPVFANGRYASTGRSRRAADLRAHAALRKPRPGSELYRSHCATNRRGPAAGPIGRAGKHHLSRHDPRCCVADPGRARTESRPRFFPGLQPRARRPRQSELHRQRHSQGRRRHRSDQRRSGRVALRQGGGQHRAGLELRSGRSLQDSGKHLPLGEHCDGQRAEDAVRPHRHRCLGSHRRRQDQAVRISGLLSGPGLGRPLHSDRSVLSELGRPQAWHDHAVHRIGRRDQHQHAAVRHPAADRRAQRRRQAAQRQPDLHPGCGLQEETSTTRAKARRSS